MIDFSGRLARGWIVWVACVVALFVAPGGAVAEDEPRAVAPAAAEARDRGPSDDETPAESDKTQFLRFIDDGKGGGRLESAIVSYRNADGVTVHLVAALHVGEKSYYQGLAKTFRDYDALLYEMVKPKKVAAPAPGTRAGGMVSGFQRFLKDVLELEFQLDAIDYSARNFVHADLDAETFTKMQKERGESMFTLMLRSMMSQMNRQGQPGAPRAITIFDLLAAMNSPDSARQYKLLLARQFEDIEAQIAGMEGPDGTVLLTERNKAAIAVLRETIERGEKEIGVFYGAGHMWGLEEALVEEMGFERVGVEWRTAWDMTGKTPTTRPVGRVRSAAPAGAN